MWSGERIYLESQFELAVSGGIDYLVRNIKYARVD